MNDPDELYIGGLKSWAARVMSLPSNEFCSCLTDMNQWPWPRQDTLQKLSPVLARLDEQLQKAVSSSSVDVLHSLLNASSLICQNTHSLTDYPSVANLILILDLSHQSVLVKVLSLLQTLAKGGCKLSKKTELMKKLFIISLGNLANNPDPRPITDVLLPIRFHYMKNDVLTENSENLPSSLEYVYLNRKRVNDDLDSNLMLQCQLRAVFCYITISTGTQSLAEFRSTVPEVWLLPNLKDLVFMPEAIDIFNAILTSHDRLKRGQQIKPCSMINYVYDMLKLGDPSGLFQRLLEEVRLTQNSSLTDSVLKLVSNILKKRPDMNQPLITATLIEILSTDSFSLSNKQRASCVLAELLSHSMSQFKDQEGLESVIGLIEMELRCIQAVADHLIDHSNLVRSLFKLLTIIITNWDPLEPSRSRLQAAILDSAILDLLRIICKEGKLELIGSSTGVINALLLQNHELVPQIIKKGAITSILEAFDALPHSSLRLCYSILRLLCTLSLHPAGVKNVRTFNLMNTLINSLGSVESHSLSTEELRAIGEGLGELLSLVSDYKERAVVAIISLLKSLPEMAQQEQFPTRLLNIARTMGVIFTHSQELTKGFIEKEGFECFLNLYRLPLFPLAISNEYHLIATFLKSIPQTMMSVTLGKVLTALQHQLSALETYIGPLSCAQDLGNIQDDQKEPLLRVMSAIEAYTEMTRFILSSTNPIKNNINTITNVLPLLADYHHVLINEQARIVKQSEKMTTDFNVQIDTEVLEDLESKTFQQQFFVKCQQSLTKLIKFVARIPSIHSRSSVPEEVGVKVSNLMGQILTEWIKKLTVGNDFRLIYAQCLRLSDFLKVLFSEQVASSAVFYVFQQSGGLEAFAHFLEQLKGISQDLRRAQELPYDLTHYFQIIWSLCGKCFEGFMSGKFDEHKSGLSILKALGQDSGQDIAQSIRVSIMELFNRVNCLECIHLSTSFAGSMLEVFKKLTTLNEETFVDPQIISQVAEMGFPEHAVKKAILNVAAPSVELVTEWILNHPEVFDSDPEPELPSLALSGTHQKLINSLPAIHGLSSEIADMLLRMSNRPDIPTEDISFMLLALTGKLAFDLLSVEDTMDVTQYMCNLDIVNVEANLDQLEAVLHVLSTLVYKSHDVYQIVKGYEFTGHACKMLAASCENYSWTAPMFDIIDCLIRQERFVPQGLIETLNAFASKITNISQRALLALCRLLESVTYSPKNSQKLLESGMLLKLLTLPSHESANKQINAELSTVIRQIAEKADVLQSLFELRIMSQLKEPKQLDRFLKDFTTQAARDDEVFQRALKNATMVYRVENKVIVRSNPNWTATNLTVNDLCKILIQSLEILHYNEDHSIQNFFSTEDVINFLADTLQGFPIYINSIIDSHRNEVSFIKNLLRVILPFKHGIQQNDYCITSNDPPAEKPVSSEVYRNWINSSCRLMRALVFRQTSLISNPLQNNQGVIQARKLVFRTCKDILTQHQGLRTPEDACQVRTVSITIMQILRQAGKAPYCQSNQAEVAKLLISEKYDFIHSFIQLTDSVKLHLVKSSNFLNLILSPLELLLQYNINLTLHAQDHNLQGMDIAQRIQSEHSDSEEDADMYFPNEDRLEDIILQNNTESFWAENFEEEEEEEQAYRPYGYGNPLLDRYMPRQTSERQPQRIIFEFDLNPDLDERQYMMQMLNMDHYPDMVRYFLQRRQQMREVVVERPIPRAQPATYSFDAIIADITAAAQEFEEPMPEERKEEIREDFIVQPIENEPEEFEEELPIVQEPDQNFVPEGIDPEVFDALPQNLRNEILAQYAPSQPPQRAPYVQSNENVSEDFLNALPPEMRAQVLNQNGPPPQAQEMDAANFIASLPPELRNEALLTASDDVLNTLPPDILAEAQVLRDRLSHRQMQNIHAERWNNQGNRRDPVKENQAIAKLAGDPRLSSELMQIDDRFMEMIVKSFFMANPISRQVLASLLLCLSAQHVNRQQIVDALSSLLVQLNPSGDFPPPHLIGNDILIESYSQVYATVSLRIIEALQYLCSCMPTISAELLNDCTHRLALIGQISGLVNPFNELVALLGREMYRKSHLHLESLIKLLAIIVQGKTQTVAEMEKSSLAHVCDLLSYQGINESTVDSLIELVKNLAKNEENRLQIVKSVSQSVEVLAAEVSQLLIRKQMSQQNKLELQMLRLCRVLNSVQGKASMSCMWQPLTDVLQDENIKIHQFFPVVEAFFVSYTNIKPDEDFYTFCEANREVLNRLVLEDPSLLNLSLSPIATSFPQLLHFKNKQLFFQEEIKKMRNESAASSIRLNIRRNHVFMDSYNQLKVRSPEEMLGRMRVQFVGEQGMDAGGLTREWYTLLAKEIFNPDYALFVPSANGASFQPNSLSTVNVDTHLLFFRFVGRFIGKAVCDFNHLDVYFTRSFYKHILGQEISYQDVEDLDPEFYNALTKLQEMNLDENDLNEFYFVLEEEEFGRTNIIELVKDGKNKRVTEANKEDYINLLCHMKMTKNIQAQIDSFLSGFYELVPKRIISMFDAKELELFISGMPTIDLRDMYANTEYHNYTAQSQVILWLWEILEEFSQQERACFIQFVTGSSKVPLEGFKALPGMNGIQKFQIHKSFVDTNRLPTSHTCMNQLDLPDYASKAQLKKILKLAITEGKEGFGFI